MNISYDYAAGIMDGEGSFLIRRSKPTHIKMGKRPWRMQAAATFTLKEKEICECFEKLFGGYVKLNDYHHRRNAKNSIYYQWTLTGPRLLEFCKIMQNHLYIKAEQCKVIFEFQSIKSSINNSPITDEQYDRTCVLYEKLIYLNRKGPNTAANLTNH